MNRNIGKKIRLLRENVLAESQEVFGHRFGVEQATVSRWEAGYVPARRYQEDIATLAGLSVAEFFFGEDGPRQIPVVGYVAGGESFTPIEDHEPGGGLEFITPKISSDHVIAVIVRGASMSPVYRDGDTIIASVLGRRDMANAIGNDCVLKTVAGEGYVKRVLAGSKRGAYRLRSYNPSYDDIEDVEIEWAARIRFIERA